MWLPSRCWWAQRGVATVEAAIALPVMTLLMIGTAELGRHYSARQEALVRVRSCAWQYSAAHCRDVPPGCEDIVGAPRGNEELEAVAGSYETDPLTGGTSLSDKVASGIQGQVDKQLGGFLGQSVTARSRIVVKGRSSVSPNAEHGSVSYHLACNVKPSKLADILGELWDDLWD